MRREVGVLGAFVAAIVHLSGCSGGGDTAPPGMAAELEGAWITSCSRASSTLYQTGVVTFAGTTVVQLATGYATATCDTPTMTANGAFAFVLGPQVWASLGASRVAATTVDYTPIVGTLPANYSIVYVDTASAPHRLHMGVALGDLDGTAPDRRMGQLSDWYLEKRP